MTNRAFTFIELILVIVIIGLLAGMVVPSLGDFKKERDLYAAAEIASSTCNYARSLAVTSGMRTRLGLDSGRNRIALLVEEDPLGKPGEFVKRSWPMGLSGALPKGVKIEQVFYPVIHAEGGEEESRGAARSANRPVEFQTAAEAAEERKSVLLFEPDGSTRDTFIYLSVGDATPTATAGQEFETPDVFTVAIVGAIGATVIVPHKRTEEIFEVYDAAEKRE
jgi:prepilin-type N-terminal cleavage/methylation domain-containing protein